MHFALFTVNRAKVALLLINYEFYFMFRFPPLFLPFFLAWFYFFFSLCLHHPLPPFISLSFPVQVCNIILHASIYLREQFYFSGCKALFRVSVYARTNEAKINTRARLCFFATQWKSGFFPPLKQRGGKQKKSALFRFAFQNESITMRFIRITL